MTLLRIEGEAQQPRDFRFEDLSALPGQVADVGQLVPGREGGGVRLQSLLDVVGPTTKATHLTITATDGKFSASVPLEAVREAIVAYRLNDAPLPAQKGGPYRFLIPQVEECAIGEVDACANVKFVGRMRLSHGPGEDTRPTSKVAHEEHHTREGHEHLK
ncbi:MAG: molybdopterin-dependent oxidoreductase [Candidatus Binatia bacterium]